MYRPRPAHLLVLFALVSASPLHAQTTRDPIGHWEGAIQAPAMELTIQVDLAKNAKGELAGTLTIPAQHVNALPLQNVAVDGESISFQMKGASAGVRLFKGAFLPDGKSIAGDFAGPMQTVPFALTRTGEPRIGPTPTSPAIAKALEGTWSGTLDVDGGLRLILTLTNQPDGTSSGSVVNLDEGLEIPIATIAQTGSSLNLNFTAVPATYVGALNQEGTELSGTFTQGPLELPLTFRRAAPGR